MELPNNITREHLLKAIEKIDAEGIPMDGDSQYYDVIYNERRYPPKVIVSYSNLFANNEILDRNKFQGGLGTECFKLLESNGFKIVKKMNGIVEKIKLFSSSYKKEVGLRYSSDLISYNLLVNEITQEIRSAVISLRSNLIVKGSIGKGTNTNYPWVGIFDPKVSTGAQNGFYVVLLFSDDFEDLYLTLNQGSTIQTRQQTEAYKNFVFSNYEFIDGFIKGKLPESSLVKTKFGSSAKLGKKYQETNIFYKKYSVSSLNEGEFISNLIRIVKVYIDCADKYSSNKRINPIETIPPDSAITSNQIISSTENLMKFDYTEFYESLGKSGIYIDENKTIRFIASLLTKPFVILTGLSGSGKTKLAQAFAMWLCERDNQYCIVPVGADWTNREPLLGFPNALKNEEYIKPDNRALDLIIEANKNGGKPYFLILDEMNLSHVERYFADFLSVMESKNKISLHSGTDTWGSVPANIQFPKNLFIIGTVNIDETTYMFSPKVLDRANVIEFRVTAEEMENFFQNKPVINLKNLEGLGSTMAGNFISMAEDENLELDSAELKETLMNFFEQLQRTGAEFGYRSASEILRFATIVKKIEPGFSMTNTIDAAIMQKLLPKVHGSRRKLEPILKTLGTLCLQDGQSFDTLFKARREIDLSDDERIKFPISFEKILRMNDNLLNNGFTSFAEA